MTLSIHDRIFHNDGTHNLLDLCNAYLFQGGSYYLVSKRHASGRDFSVIKHHQQLSFYVSCAQQISYLLIIPVILAGIGLLIGRYLYDYKLDELPATSSNAQLQMETKEANESISLENGFVTLGAVLYNKSSFIFTFNNQNYKVSRKDTYNKEVTVTIEGPSHESSLTFHEDTGRTTAKISSEHTALLQECIKEAYRLSSKYELGTSILFIEVIQKGLEIIPLFHLESLFKELSAKSHKIYAPKSNFHLSVTFVKDNLKSTDGSDLGGLSRSFIDELVRGLKKTKVIETLQDGSELMLPVVRNGLKEQYSNVSQSCQESEQKMYEKLGFLMGFCMFFSERYLSAVSTKKSCLGQHFHLALFQTLVCLTGEEVETPFEKLSIETRIKMHEALLEDVFDWDFKHSRKLIRGIKKELKADERNEIITFVCLANPAVKKEDLQNPKELAKHLFCLLTATQEHASLAPIHAIAKGLKAHLSASEWNNDFYQKDPLLLSQNIQGVVDREEVAKCFVTKGVNQEITRKVEWLKEWILTKATDVQLGLLLRYFTGCSGLPKGRIISISKQHSKEFGRKYSPLPVAHTCGLTAEFSPEPVTFSDNGAIIDCLPSQNTKENYFILIEKCLLPIPNTYQLS